MSPLQIGSLALAFLGPVAIWAVHRRRPDPKLERNFARGIAWFLIVVLIGCGVQKYFYEGMRTWAEALPMHLCDWALVAVVIALLSRNQTCFELGYFWGLCGTVQAIFTPAVQNDIEWWRLIGFYLDHAGIVAGVMYLLLVPKMRPQGLWRVILWSEIYLLCALTVNWMAEGNYGFLSHRPDQWTLLNLFPDPHWLYVVTINLFALVMFTIFYLPWFFVERATRRAVPS